MLMKKPPNRKAGEVVGALDIGTSKVCCLIAASDGKGRHRLLGFGHQRMRGIKAGVVVDPEKAERGGRAAIAQAERMAGLTLARVVVAVTCGRLKSETFTARATVAGRSASGQDEGQPAEHHPRTPAPTAGRRTRIGRQFSPVACRGALEAPDRRTT